MTDVNGEPLDPVEKRLSSIESEVGSLRVLAEANEQTIRLIAEGHGAKLDSLSKKLDDIMKALEPLQQLRGFPLVADNHERRITALERHTGIPQ